MKNQIQHLVWQPYICQLTTVDIAQGIALSSLRGQKLRSVDITRACFIADKIISSLTYNLNRNVS
ncbi:Uncharacterised protein [Plesiomonas shigelloides]|nr:Uncharacterised protein [Plesiomonas shigelloides]